jgi:hypothetical protein
MAMLHPKSHCLMQVLLPPLRMEVASVPPPPFGGSTVGLEGRRTVVSRSGSNQATSSFGTGAGCSGSPTNECTGADNAAAGQPGAADAACGSRGSWAEGRRYLTCCVRISQEKEPHRYHRHQHHNNHHHHRHQHGPNNDNHDSQHQQHTGPL